MTNELVKTQNNELLATEVVDAPLGFEDEEAADMIIPRVKMVQSLSPERKEKLADEGDIINSLTKERLNGKKFIPVFKFNSNILWKDRSEGGGIACHARDGRFATLANGQKLACAICRKCEFDNTKTGRDALPTCTKYINFFGFFEGERMPIILSFAKTNFKEGKKLYSLAKVTMQNMWNFGYTLEAKEQAKNGNEWYIIDVAPAGATSDEDRAFGMELFKSFRNSNLVYDMEEGTADTSSSNVSEPTISADNTEF